MVRPSHRSLSNASRSTLPPFSIRGMRGSRKTSCDGLARWIRSDGYTKISEMSSFVALLFEYSVSITSSGLFETFAYFLKIILRAILCSFNQASDFKIIFAQELRYKDFKFKVFN